MKAASSDEDDQKKPPADPRWDSSAGGSSKKQKRNRPGNKSSNTDERIDSDTADNLETNVEIVESSVKGKKKKNKRTDIDLLEEKRAKNRQKAARFRARNKTRIADLTAKLNEQTERGNALENENKKLRINVQHLRELVNKSQKSDSDCASVKSANRGESTTTSHGVDTASTASLSVATTTAAVSSSSHRSQTSQQQQQQQQQQQPSLFFQTRPATTPQQRQQSDGQSSVERTLSLLHSLLSAQSKQQQQQQQQQQQHRQHQLLRQQKLLQQQQKHLQQHQQQQPQQQQQLLTREPRASFNQDNNERDTNKLLRSIMGSLQRQRQFQQQQQQQQQPQQPQQQQSNTTALDSETLQNLLCQLLQNNYNVNQQNQQGDTDKGNTK